MFELAVLVLMLPVVALADWFRFIARQTPGLPQELARASHGAAMVVFALLFALRFYGGRSGSPPWMPGAVCAGVALWGLAWLVIGAGRTRMPYVDAHLMSRALVKTGFGLVALYLAWVHRVPTIFGDRDRGSWAMPVRSLVPQASPAMRLHRGRAPRAPALANI
jgi:hypothetical protein